MLSSILYAMLTLFHTTYLQKLFQSDRVVCSIYVSIVCADQWFYVHLLLLRLESMEIQCDAIRWEQFENWHFSRGYNFWTNDLILILKTPTCP